jgi:hypothetical protein
LALNADPEYGTSEASKLLNGFPKIAAQSTITGNIDETSDVFKIFQRSAVRNLLYLQSRVAALQAKQARFDLEDYNSCRREYDLNLFDTYFGASQKNFEDLEIRLAYLEGYLKEDANKSGNSTSNGTAPEPGNATVQDIEPNKSVFLRMHERLLKLEEGRILPQDLFWGPVSDRGPRIMSGVPEDFVHNNCPYEGQDFAAEQATSTSITRVKSQRTCLYCETYRKTRKEHDKVLQEGSEPHVIQMLQQRIRILEDYYENESSNRLGSNPDVRHAGVQSESRAPALAITLAARSWEDFEIFGSAEKMWERRRTWEALGAINPWPFDISDVWVGKMRERYDVARDLQHAIKEYCKWSLDAWKRDFFRADLRI